MPKEKNLYEQLASTTRNTRTVKFFPGHRQYKNVEANPRGEFVTDEKAKALSIDLIELSSESNSLIQGLGFTVSPPKKFRKERSPDGMGTHDVEDGFDLDDPDYQKARLDISLKQDSMTCLLACPELLKTTPGKSIDAQIENIQKNIGQSVVAGMAAAAAALQHGVEGADFFTGTDSETSQS